MTHELDRSAGAARRLLAARTRDPEIGKIQLELAAWTIAKAGGRVPELADETEDLYVRMAAAFGAGDRVTGLQLVADNCETEEEDRLLFHACRFAGDLCPDELLAIAAANRDVLFDGQMLWRTSTPERLLELTDDDPNGSNAAATVAELVIQARDRGAPFAAAEERWERLTRVGQRRLTNASLRDGMLRIAARESVDEAVKLLQWLLLSYDYDDQIYGTQAVLGRLVRVDPARACAIVAAQPTQAARTVWLETLVVDFSLPAAAEPIVDELLGQERVEQAGVLARAMIAARRLDLLDRTLPRLADDDALESAGIIAPAVAALRWSGHGSEAESARDRVVGVLGDAADDDGLAARDLFDVLSAPERPTLLPWGRAPLP
ncbi:MAG TPA: hypothetical protein VLT45_18770 [Kofleriaceae bacterium]|nr:hypothetical protein [Kofleriaceae bacterium]